MLHVIVRILPLTNAGKQWHENKTAFRPTAGLTSFAKRMEEKKFKDAMKAKEKEMKEEKEAERQVRITVHHRQHPLTILAAVDTRN
jgi:prolyl-tRNA editing enzyme YbaK/EbsC (Cys-tRNA(Pro) deacylase)